MPPEKMILLVRGLRMGISLEMGSATDEGILIDLLEADFG